MRKVLLQNNPHWKRKKAILINYLMIITRQRCMLQPPSLFLFCLHLPRLPLLISTDIVSINQVNRFPFVSRWRLNVESVDLVVLKRIELYHSMKLLYVSSNNDVGSLTETCRQL